MASKTPIRDRLISDKEAADLLGVSPTTVRRLRNHRDGTLTTVYVRGVARIRESEVLAFISRGGES